MNLREATGFLMRAHDIGRWVELADNYIRLYNKMPASFVLPSDHSVLKPVIDAFAADAHAFCDYIRALRDGSSGAAYDELHYQYRTISLRTLQNERRKRVKKAVDQILPTLEKKLDRPLTYQEKQSVGRVVEQVWGIERMRVMSDERALRRSDRLSSEERSEVLITFWRSIDDKLEKGEPVFDKNELNRMLKVLL
jgi:hypothetical protein